ncbi:MAG: hypothetical protein WBC91_12600 [Phototrophicaceae bacterium]
MKIKFRYGWYDEDKTILSYIAESDWNWRDWHAGWQPAKFSLIQHVGNVHTVIDFREQTRTAMPAGINAHFNSFGKSLSPKLSGKAVVIGLPESGRAQLMLDADGTFETKTGRLYFVQTDEEAQALLATFNQTC